MICSCGIGIDVKDMRQHAKNCLLRTTANEPDEPIVEDGDDEMAAGFVPDVKPDEQSGMF